MTIRLSPTRRVACEAVIALPLTARQAWGQLRDFHRYAAHDHFHAGFIIEGNVPRQGARLHIQHRYGPFRTARVGRITIWREGEGFAFSDLCAADHRRAFPHALSMRVSDNPDVGGCKLRIRVTGMWTAPTPRWLGRLWLAWVFAALVQRTRNALLLFAARRMLKPPSREHQQAAS